MLRPGRFKHRLLDDTFLQTQSSAAALCLQEFFPLWQQKRLTDAEIAAVYIAVFSFLRRPKDFLGGPHNQILPPLPPGPRLSCQEFRDILTPALPAELRSMKALARFSGEEGFLSFFCHQSWRSIPLSVAQSLMAWDAGIYPLKMLDYVPSPEEVLNMQAQGVRCVTMLQQQKEMQELVEAGRDVLGFIVHDLIHADHFFADPDKAQAQIRFSQKLQDIYRLPPIQKMLQDDALFRHEFEYLMSDMNSVPLHLLKTLKAILLGHFKRLDGQNMKETLHPRHEAAFTELYQTCLRHWDFHSSEALGAALRLNTPLCEGPNDYKLLHAVLSQ